jgi:hypothetical protein
MSFNVALFKKSTGLVSFRERLFRFWMKRYKFVLFFCLLSVCGWSLFFWYRSLNFQWSEEVKQNYKEAQAHQTALDEKGLNWILEALHQRKTEHVGEHHPLRNIFLQE